MASYIANLRISGGCEAWACAIWFGSVSEGDRRHSGRVDFDVLADDCAEPEEEAEDAHRERKVAGHLHDAICLEGVGPSLVDSVHHFLVLVCLGVGHGTEE